MQDEVKTKEQLIFELHEMRKRVAELEKDQAEFKRAENFLRHRSDELQLILDTVPATIWFKDKENNILRVNKAACEMLGVKAADVEGKHTSEVFPDWLAEKYYQDDLEVMNSERPKMGIEEEITKSSGELRWVHTDKIPWFDEQGNLAGVLAFAVDITERKLAEEALRASEDKYRKLAESIPGMVFQFILHKDGSFSLPYVNERIMQYAGISPEAAMAEPSLLFNPIHSDDQEMFQQAISDSARTLRRFSVEHRLIDSNRKLRWFRVESMPQRLSNGDILWNGVSIDITKRKRTEASLAASEQRFKLLYEQAPMAYQSLDENGNFIEVNQAWLEALGFTKEEVVGRSFADFLHPDWRNHFKENFPRFKAIGEVLGVEFEMIKKDGSTILVSFHGKIGREPNGRFKQTHCTFQRHHRAEASGGTTPGKRAAISQPV